PPPTSTRQTMLRLHRVALLATLVASTLHAQATETYRPVANRLIDAALKDSSAWKKIAELTDTFGNRLSGSDALQKAIDWSLARMKAEGLDNVRGEPAMVPHWVRGAESAELITPRRKQLAMLGLGGSVGTPAEGITAPVLVVSDFAELTRRASEAKG